MLVVSHDAFMNGLLKSVPSREGSGPSRVLHTSRLQITRFFKHADLVEKGGLGEGIHFHLFSVV